MFDDTPRLSVLHVMVRAGATNSQYNEHCLPTAAERDLTVCSLFPADVSPPPSLTFFEGSGTSVRQCLQVLRRALDYRDHDVVHVHAPASGILTLLLYGWTRRSRDNLVFTVHNSWKNFRLRNRVFLRIIMALIPTIAVCGHAAHESMPERLRHRRAARLTVIQNGVDVDRIDEAIGDIPPRADDDARERPGMTIVSVGRLIKLKDPATLVEAFHRGRRAGDHLVIVGEGDLRRNLERQVRRRGLEGHVSFLGMVPRDEVFRVLAGADLVLSTSRGEGLPVALLESMACGSPTVVTDIAPHREVAREAPSIPLVPVGDVAGFARAIRRMGDLGPTRRRSVGSLLRATARERFSVAAMNRAYGDLYERVAAAGAARSWTAPSSSGGRHLGARVTSVLLLTAIGAAMGLGFAQYQDPRYTAEATLLVGSMSANQADEDAMGASARQAASYADLVRRQPVLVPVAAQGFAPSWRELQPDIDAETGDNNPQLVRLSVHAGSIVEARALVTAVADQLMDVTEEGRASAQQDFVGDQIALVQGDIARTRSDIRAVSTTIAASDPSTARRNLRKRLLNLQTELSRLQASYVDLEGLQGEGTGRISWVDRPWASDSPVQPVPLVLAVAGGAMGFTLAVAWWHLTTRRPPSRLLATGRDLPGPRRGPAHRDQAVRHNGRPAVTAGAWAAGDPGLGVTMGEEDR